MTFYFFFLFISLIIIIINLFLVKPIFLIISRRNILVDSKKKKISNPFLTCYDYGTLPINGPKWCKEVWGQDYRYIGREQDTCPKSFGKPICKKFDISRRKTDFWDECVEFSKVPYLGTKTCKKYFGPSAIYMGRHREECMFGQGKGICEFPKSFKKKKFIPKKIIEIKSPRNRSDSVKNKSLGRNVYKKKWINTSKQV